METTNTTNIRVNYNKSQQKLGKIVTKGLDAGNMNQKIPLKRYILSTLIILCVYFILKLREGGVEPYTFSFCYYVTIVEVKQPVFVLFASVCNFACNKRQKFFKRIL